MQDTATAWLVDDIADRVVLAVAVLAILGLTVAILNILARQRRADEAAAMVQADLWAVIDAVPASINAKDRYGRFTFINYGQATFRGLDKFDAIGKTPSEAYGDDYKSWDNDERNEQIFRDGNPAPRFEEQFPDNDGAVGTWLTTKAPLFDATGAVSQVVTISLDITDRKDAENQAAKAHERLVDALESVPRAFALFDADDCLVMCNRKAALTYVTPRAYTGNLILKRNLARDLPLLRADESKIKQILLNLLSNAVKFTPPGGTVRVRARRHSDGGVELSVRDDGIGVAAEN
jgi:PAS domain S-box-containing protein